MDIESDHFSTTENQTRNGSGSWLLYTHIVADN